MKRTVLLTVCAAAVLTLTACGKTENISADLSAERSVLIAESAPQVVQSAPESTASSTPDDEKNVELPKLGELVGPEDLPSRGRAACIVTKNTIYLQNEEHNRSETEIFDEHGNSLYRERAYGEPEITSYEYDDRGNVTREYYEADYYCDNEYDENGRLVSYEAFRDGEPVWSGSSVFDEHGEVSETHSAIYFGDAEPEETVRYYDNIYDDGGRRISSTVYFSDHTEVWEINNYEYDGDILKRRVCTEPRDDHNTIREYEFDENINIVSYKVTVYETDGSIKNTYREEKSYNADGKIEQMLYYNKDGELEMKELYEYKYAN